MTQGGFSAVRAGRPLLAVTLWPEWAFAVVRLGKRVENRDFALGRRHAWLAIHAGAHVGGRAARWARAAGLRALRDEAAPRGHDVEPSQVTYGDGCVGVTVDGSAAAIATSAIVAVARFAGSQAPPHSKLPPWGRAGYHHWIIETVRTFDPIGGVRGNVGLWRCDPHIVEQIRERCPSW